MAAVTSAAGSGSAVSGDSKVVNKKQSSAKWDARALRPLELHDDCAKESARDHL
jgi:hypothetical protein